MESSTDLIVSIPAKLEHRNIIPLGRIPDSDDFDVIITFIKRRKRNFLDFAGSLTESDAQEIEQAVNECRKIDLETW